MCRWFESSRSHQVKFPSLSGVFYLDGVSLDENQIFCEAKVARMSKPRAGIHSEHGCRHYASEGSRSQQEPPSKGPTLCRVFTWPHAWARARQSRSDWVRWRGGARRSLLRESLTGKGRSPLSSRSQGFCVASLRSKCMCLPSPCPRCQYVDHVVHGGIIYKSAKTRLAPPGASYREETHEIHGVVKRFSDQLPG